MKAIKIVSRHIQLYLRGYFQQGYTGFDPGLQKQIFLPKIA